MRISHAEAVKRGWVQQKDVPASAKEEKPRRGEIEGEEQTVLIEEFRARYPVIGHLLIHIPNGGSRKNAFEGYRLKRQGVRAGVSDLLLPVARGGFFGLWIEFKAAPPNDAAVAPSQKEWIELMADQGYCAEVCLGVEDAMSFLIRYMSWPATVALPSVEPVSSRTV